jgi:hypothetical protein
MPISQSETIHNQTPRSLKNQVFGALLINHYFPWEEFKGEPLIRKVQSRPKSRKTYSVFV